MIMFCVGLAVILLRNGRAVTCENSPDLGVQGSPWRWPRMAKEVSSLWHTSWVSSLATEFGFGLLYGAHVCIWIALYEVFYAARE